MQHDPTTKTTRFERPLVGVVVVSTLDGPVVARTMDETSTGTMEKDQRNGVSTMILEPQVLVANRVEYAGWHVARDCVLRHATRDVIGPVRG